MEVQYTENLKPHSVEIKTNAKGEPSISVKSYGQTLDEAKVEAIKIFEELRTEYHKKD